MVREGVGALRRLNPDWDIKARAAGALAELTAEEMGNNAAKRENAFFGLYTGTVVFDFL